MYLLRLSGNPTVEDQVPICEPVNLCVTRLPQFADDKPQARQLIHDGRNSSNLAMKF
ncbi:hypothetical protein CBM2609_B70272 [Cupriavidus taiwanensis]|nr:hypothetical protein CBM2604_B60271 [Cupriavidus taiwanensis]SOZ33328.1 hypothetical protein CBM2609_B70272 [Cupriavidus taiwanensis]SOZ48643.1 hypothetical protein CBM2610_B50272 [Cupriavidus taiwanensis]